MSEEGGQGGRAAFSHKSAEVVVALGFFAIGAIVVYDSLRLGAKWAEDGPQAGYLPFYIGLIICVSAVVNLVQALRVPAAKGKAFVEVEQLKMVLAVLVPTSIYVAAISFLGLYVSSTLFVAYFMRWLGKYEWWKIAAVSIGNSVFFFVIFETWFKIPLPKGPLESLLGY